jgi:hypothetical protein
LLNICSKIDVYEESKKKLPSKNEFFFISIKHDGIYLNDIKIIDKKAELQMAIFKILMTYYVEDIFNNTSTYISISKINSSLKNYGISIDDYENQIRKNIYKIRLSIKSAHPQIGKTSIIDSVNWGGYRISDQVFLRKF